MRLESVLGQDFFDHCAVDIGKTVISSLEPVGESFVVDTQAGQNRGMEVMHMYRVLIDVVAKLIGLAV